MKKIIDIDYINIRDAHVHGIINPTFIMYGNCDLEKYDFEVEVDGIKRKAKFKPDLASDNYELIVPLNNSDKLVEVYLIANNERQLVCIRENTRMKRIKSKIRVILRKVFGNMAHRLRKLKYIIRVLFNELKFILKNHTVKGSIKRIKYNLSRLELEIRFYNFMKQEDYLECL